MLNHHNLKLLHPLMIFHDESFLEQLFASFDITISYLQTALIREIIHNRTTHRSGQRAQFMKVSSLIQITRTQPQPLNVWSSQARGVVTHVPTRREFWDHMDLSQLVPILGPATLW